jgi:hypothetical protein
MSLLQRTADRPFRYDQAVPSKKFTRLGEMAGHLVARMDGAEWQSSKAGRIPTDDVRASFGKPNVAIEAERVSEPLDNGTDLEKTAYRRWDRIPAGTFDAFQAERAAAARKVAEVNRPRPRVTGGHGIFAKVNEKPVWLGERIDPDLRIEAMALGLELPPVDAFVLPGEPPALTPRDKVRRCAAAGIRLSATHGKLQIDAAKARIIHSETLDELRDCSAMLVLHLEGKWAETPCERADPHGDGKPHPVGEDGLTYDFGVFGCAA